MSSDCLKALLFPLETAPLMQITDVASDAMSRLHTLEAVVDEVSEAGKYGEITLSLLP